MKYLPNIFKTSSIKITGNEKIITRTHSLKFKGAIPKIFVKIGTYRIKKWEPIEAAIASNKYGLTNGLIVKRESSSDIAFKALNISITTNTDNERVDAFTFPVVKYKQGFFCKSIPSIKLTG